ncbi:MAG: hypothetical protein HY925_02325 [Elusimicrobia bacterium]|nr:hypothetical protein [Elusimicrobiota bacterium]
MAPEGAEGGPTFGTADAGDVDPGANVPEVPAFENVTPYQWAVTLAKFLCYALCVLGLIMAVLQKFIAYPGVLAAFKACLMIVEALAAVLTLLGIYMIAMGQYWQGTMYTIIGGVALVVAMLNPETIAANEGMALQTAGLALGAAGGGMLADTAHEGDTDDDVAKHKSDYRKKYGVDPDTKRVVNPEKWDKRYGKGSADAYNDQRQYDDMS